MASANRKPPFSKNLRRAARCFSLNRNEPRPCINTIGYFSNSLSVTETMRCSLSSKWILAIHPQHEIGQSPWGIVSTRPVLELGYNQSAAIARSSGQVSFENRHRVQLLFQLFASSKTTTHSHRSWSHRPFACNLGDLAGFDTKWCVQFPATRQAHRAVDDAHPATRLHAIQPKVMRQKLGINFRCSQMGWSGEIFSSGFSKVSATNFLSRSSPCRRISSLDCKLLI